MKPIFFCLFLCYFLSGNIQLFAQCGTRQLDPKVAAFLKMIGNEDLSIEQLRQLPIETIKFAGPPLIPYPERDVQRIKITADSIPVLVFNPSHKTNLPIIINYHGGGFIAPLIPALEHSLWLDAKNYEMIVFAVDYRVAPEHKFPAAHEDSYHAFTWISENGGSYGGDTSRIALLGHSAGANLVAYVCQKAKKEGISHKIKLQVMNGLPADLSPKNMETSLSYQQNATGYFQTKASCYFSVELYAPGKYDDPAISPLFTKDLSGLPAAVIINAEFDPLRDDGILYAAELRKNGVRVWEKCFAGQIHCLIGLQPGADELKDFESIIKTAMKESFNNNY